MGLPTYTSIEQTRNELAKTGASIKIMHTGFPKGTKFGYAAAITIAPEYRNQVTQLDATWAFTKPTNTATYAPQYKILYVR